MFRKIGSIVTAEKITIADWRKLIVEASTRQEPDRVEKLAEFDLDKDSFLYVRARAVSCFEMHGPNANGDAFEASELEKYYPTFIRRGAYMNHNADSPEKAIGIILDASWHPKQGFVQCLMAIDRQEQIARKIEAGIANSWSMGAMVKYCVCSVCEQKCESEDQYCNHLANYLGREYQGKKVFSFNKDLSFYELSNVTVPADPNAYTLQVMAETKLPNQLVALADRYEKVVEKGKTGALVEAPEASATNSEIVSDVRGKLVAASAKPLNERQILGTVRHKLKVAKAPLIPRTGEIHRRVQSALVAGSQPVEQTNNSIQETTPMEGLLVENNLTVRYVPGDKLEDCIFIARKGKLQASVSASKLLDKAAQSKILASERPAQIKQAWEAEKLKDDSKPSPDNTGQNVSNSDSGQPMDEVNPLSAEPAKELKDESKPQPDHKIELGKDPEQPSDVVKRYAQMVGAKSITFKKAEDGGFVAHLSGASISRLAQLWGTAPRLVKEVAKQANLAGNQNLAREHAQPEEYGKKNCGDMPVYAREDVKPLAKPAGSQFGNESKSYFQGLNSKDLSTGGEEGWAKKVAELSKEAATLKQANTALRLENETLKKSMEATKKASIEDKKMQVISTIVSFMEKAGALRVSAEDILDLQEKGLSHDDAQVKAYSVLRDRKVAELRGLDLVALDTMAKNMSDFIPQVKTASRRNLEIPQVGREEAPSMDEDFLAKNWD